MKNYNRVMLGSGGMYAKQCYTEGYIGVDFDIKEDLSDSLFENWRDFNAKYVPIWKDAVPGKSQVAAGLACGFLWTVVKGLKIGDVVLSPTGEGSYYVGTITGDYYYVPGSELPHRRRVVWSDKVILRKAMSEQLRNSTGSIGTCCNITKYAAEIENLIDKSRVSVVEEEPAKPTSVHKGYDERSLHKLFCSFLRSQKIYAKTIFHEKSSAKTDHTQKWVHPDIIAAQFAEFSSDATVSLMKATEPKEMVEIYSYEMKKSIESDSQLKQYYFQAVSNSSWANYGYLVAFEIEETLYDEIERLNNAFGIGVILMQAHESRILFPARKCRLDYNTIEKLNRLNEDFCSFIEKLSKVMNATKDYTTDAKLSFEKICDKVFESDDELESYCQDKNIPY